MKTKNLQKMKALKILKNQNVFLLTKKLEISSEIQNTLIKMHRTPDLFEKRLIGGDIRTIGIKR